MARPSKMSMRLKKAKEVNTVLSTKSIWQKTQHKIEIDNLIGEHHKQLSKHERCYAMYDEIVKTVQQMSTNSILLEPEQNNLDYIPNRVAIQPSLRDIGVWESPNEPVVMEIYYNIMEYLHTNFHNDGMSNRVHFYVTLSRPDDSAMWRSAYAFDTESLPYIDEHACMYIAKEMWDGIRRGRRKY
jgi:hypothetical protein